MIPRLCVLLAVAAATPAVARADHVLAFKQVKSNVYLERLDARTLKPLPGKQLLVATKPQIDWDFSPDGTQLIVASNKARVVDLPTFRVRNICCLPMSVTDPDYVGILWTSEGVQVMDDNGANWNLDGSGNTPTGPTVVADYAKGPHGLAELYDFGGSWAVTDSTTAPDPQDVAGLSGEPVVRMAGDNRRVYLMSPAGKLVTLGGSQTVESIPLPPTTPPYDFWFQVWSPGRLIARTSDQLVLVDPQRATGLPLPLHARSFATGSSDLAVWNDSQPDGVYVYDRNGTQRFHLLPTKRVGCVLIHRRFAYVAVSNGGGCSRANTILDLASGRTIGYGTAPKYLVG